MSKVRLYGDTSGFVDLKAPDVAGDVTITLPNTSGPFATETYVDAAVAAIPDIAGIGSNVVTVVNTASQTINTGTFTDLTGMSLSFTPSSATSKVLLLAQIGGGIELAGTSKLRITATSGGNSPELVQSYVSHSRHDVIFTLVHLHSPATTSAVTYKVQGTGGGTVYRYNKSLTAIEVAA